MSELTDPQGIYKELLEQMGTYQEQLRERSEDLEVESLSAISVQKLDKGIRITGVLLAEGMHNGIFYSGEEIKKMVKNFKDRILGMDMTVEHERTSEFGDKVVGTHTHVEFNPTLKAALYSATIDDINAVAQVNEGKLSATSLRLKERKVTVGDYTQAKDLTPLNNTLTAFPACTNCNVFHTEDLSLNYFGIQNITPKEEGENMSEEIEGQTIVPVILENKEELQKYKCPADSKKFDSFKDFLKHWIEEHKEEYGKYTQQESMQYYPKLMKDLELSEEDTKELTEILSAFTKFISKCRKGGKSMKECAAEWKVEHSENSEPEDEESVEDKESKCPVCDKTFELNEEFIKHWDESHTEEHGKYEDYKEKTENTEEEESELKRKRCPYCSNLFESLSKHFLRCESRKKTLTRLYQCNYCEESYKKEHDFLEHLPNCEKYNLSKAELSEEKKEEECEECPDETPEEKPEEVEESKEKETEGEEVKEKEVEAPKETPKEEEKEEKKETPKEEEEVVETPPEKPSKEEIVKAIMDSKIEGKTNIEKAVDLLLKGEEERW